MKKLLKGFLIFVVVCFIIGYFFGYILSSLPKLSYTAKAFLFTLSTEHYDEAYKMLTPDFQKRVNLEQFKSTVQSTNLNKFRDVIWIKPDVYTDERSGYTVGVVYTTSNTKFVVQFDFSLIEAQPKQMRWEINNISFPDQYNEEMQALPSP
ncbi:MAG: hypothetical protein AB7V32_02410 [Candidatus Berkiella sp.]